MNEVQIDINDLLARFARENAAVTQRAVLAEARADALDAEVRQLRLQLAEIHDTKETP